MSYESLYPEIGELVGKTITSIENNNDVLRFACNDGTVYVLHHEQDCCERVYLEDVEGDLDDLLNSPVLSAYETSSDDEDGWPCDPLSPYDESWTWTFYRIGTIKGSVVLRWYGSSNGYYSQSVSFRKVA